MPFGLVTQKQLDALAADLRREIEASRTWQDDIVMQWESWYAKFRALYARIMKQAKKGEQEALEETNGGQPGVELPPIRFRPRRGF
jgi:hypothetical protein